jgi:hypothetical protein
MGKHRRASITDRLRAWWAAWTADETTRLDLEEDDRMWRHGATPDQILAVREARLRRGIR